MYTMIVKTEIICENFYRILTMVENNGRYGYVTAAINGFNLEHDNILPHYAGYNAE